MKTSWSWLPATTISLAASVAVAGLAVWPSAPEAAPSMAGMSMPPAHAAAPAPAGTNAVTIQGFVYAPATMTVKVGTTVTWTNQDQDPHTVTSMNGGPLRSPTLNNGQSFRYTFNAPGHFDYLCTIHPFMTATVVVTP
ncbi:cupredoxin domain-containing protein [Pseudonocardia acaciae]|uniref:cupredoxin domain-containing protein n=1 Tax=Pseudonocardia acaciae TaxID=551276 RepID=UPI000A8FFB18|nr:cupredoxin family copper-binding protein [Pseudonocardia acaciae]